eukprot:gene2655-3333_t
MDSINCDRLFSLLQDQVSDNSSPEETQLRKWVAYLKDAQAIMVDMQAPSMSTRISTAADRGESGALASLEPQLARLDELVAVRVLQWRVLQKQRAQEEQAADDSQDSWSDYDIKAEENGDQADADVAGQKLPAPQLKQILRQRPTGSRQPADPQHAGGSGLEASHIPVAKQEESALLDEIGLMTSQLKNKAQDLSGLLRSDKDIVGKGAAIMEESIDALNKGATSIHAKERTPWNRLFGLSDVVFTVGCVWVAM